MKKITDFLREWIVIIVALLVVCGIVAPICREAAREQRPQKTYSAFCPNCNGTMMHLPAGSSFDCGICGAQVFVGENGIVGSVNSAAEPVSGASILYAATAPTFTVQVFTKPGGEKELVAILELQEGQVCGPEVDKRMASEMRRVAGEQGLKREAKAANNWLWRLGQKELDNVSCPHCGSKKPFSIPPNRGGLKCLKCGAEFNAKNDGTYFLKGESYFHGVKVSEYPDLINSIRNEERLEREEASGGK